MHPADSPVGQFARSASLRGALALSFALSVALGAQGKAASPAYRPPLATDTILRIDGDIAKPLSLTLAQLTALPQDTISVKIHDAPQHVYRGVPMAIVLQLAGAPTGHELRGPALTTFVLATARDGYHVVYSLAELDTGFVKRRVLLALTSDGQPLGGDDGPLRVIVEGEGRPARWMRQLASLRIQQLVKSDSARR